MTSIALELLRRLNKPAQERACKFHDIDGTPSTCVELGEKYGYSQSHISNVFSRANYNYVETFNILNSTEVKSRGTVFRDMNGDLMTAEELSNKYGYVYRDVIDAFRSVNWCYKKAYAVLDSNKLH